jgi:hypothetical protein
MPARHRAMVRNASTASLEGSFLSERDLHLLG